MDWIKPLTARTGKEPWNDDLPLDAALPERLVVDADHLAADIHPMFAVRLRLFIAWHAAQGRAVEVRLASTPAVADELRGLGVLESVDGLEVAETGLLGVSHEPVLPVTRLQDGGHVEIVAERTLMRLEYELTEWAEFGQAAYMAISEFCGNAVEHGRNVTGAFVAVSRFVQPRRRIVIAVGDLGMGIPEHVRAVHPEWTDDDFAIARATEEGVSGTGRPDRGNGFSETFDAALVSRLQAARLEVVSGTGYMRRESVQETVKWQAFPAAARRRGTWLVYELVAAQR